MKFLVVIPHYGTNLHLLKLLPTLGYGDFTDELVETNRVVLPLRIGAMERGEIFIWNNNLVNLGFTRACNEGIRYGINNGFDIILLLNNDTSIPSLGGLLDGIVDEVKNHENTGVMGFKILSMDDPDFIHHGGTGPSYPAGQHKVGRVSLGHLEKRTEERWVTGAIMAVTAGCIMEIGVLDENMVNYGSDADYCFRARHAGFKVIYLPIPILHKIGQSANPSPAQMRVIKSDMLKFQSKWITGKLFHDLETEYIPL